MNVKLTKITGAEAVTLPFEKLLIAAGNGHLDRVNQMIRIDDIAYDLTSLAYGDGELQASSLSAGLLEQLLPASPAEGTHTLKSVEGVIQWVADM